MVVTQEAPTKETLHKTLLPFHEYECTGYLEYVVFVDETAEVEEDWENKTTEMYKDPADGTLRNSWDDYFNGWELDDSYLISGSDKLPIPEGFVKPEGSITPEMLGHVKVEVSVKEVYDSIGDFAKEYHGYELQEENGVVKFARNTNTDAQWDWYQVGGRWSGMLQVKEGADAEKGDASWAGEYNPSGVDVCQFKDLDLDAMLKLAHQRLESQYRTAAKNAADKGFVGSFEEFEKCAVRAGMAEKDLRDRWESAERPGRFADFIDSLEKEEDDSAKTLRESERLGLGGFFGMEIGQTLQQMTDEAEPFSTFATLKDGTWSEQGALGWFGMVGDEKDAAEWANNFNAVLDTLNPEDYITIVDCHI